MAAPPAPAPTSMSTLTPTFSRSSTMIRSAVRLPIPGTACRRAASPAASAATSSRGGPAGEHRERDLGADGLHGEQHQEEVALLLGVKAVQRERVVAHDQVGVQHRLAAHRRDVAQRLGRHRRAVADAPAEDHHVIGAAHRDLASQQGDHARGPRTHLVGAQIEDTVTAPPPPRPRRPPRVANGAAFRWQSATASASEAWSGVGSSGSDSSVCTIRATCALPARPLPQTEDFTRWGCRRSTAPRAPRRRASSPRAHARPRRRFARSGRSTAAPKPSRRDACSSISSSTRRCTLARRDSRLARAGVSITPPSSAAIRRPRRATTP